MQLKLHRAMCRRCIYDLHDSSCCKANIQIELARKQLPSGWVKLPSPGDWRGCAGRFCYSISDSTTELPSSAALCSGEPFAGGLDANSVDTSRSCSTPHAVAHLSPGGLDAVLQDHSCLLQHLSPLVELGKCFLALLEQHLHSRSNQIRRGTS